MKPRRTKAVTPPAPAEVLTADRDVLTSAFQKGLIVAWRRDNERGYRLTIRDRGDEYVEVAKLTDFLDKLGRRAS